MSKGLILAFVALVLGALAIGFWAKSRFEGQMSEMQTRLYEGIARLSTTLTTSGSLAAMLVACLKLPIEQVGATTWN